MKKVRYIFGRIKNMNFKNMFKTIDKIHTLSGKSKVFIFFDMIICALRYQSGYVDYLLFEMWRLNAKERETVLTRGKNNIFVKYYNNKEFNHIFLNKNVNKTRQITKSFYFCFITSSFSGNTNNQFTLWRLDVDPPSLTTTQNFQYDVFQGIQDSKTFQLFIEVTDEKGEF